MMYLSVLTLAGLFLLQVCSAATVQEFHQLPRVDPEVYMNVTQLITSKGYPCEEHEVLTEDGYILGLQRIPRGRNESPSNTTRPVVLIWHGFLMCSSCFVENLANESLGFILADAGMDVWLANSRGNTYSKKHKTLDPKSLAFWEFSYDEMAKYDLPATLDYVLKETNQEDLWYIGHSQGTVIGFIGFAYPELAKKIKTFFALAPVTAVAYLATPIRFLAPISKEFQLINELFGKGELLPDTKVNKFLGQDFCSKVTLDIICENVLFLLGGYDVHSLNKSRVPVYVAEHPAGSSVQNLNHYAQGVLYKNFQMYDYGSKAANMKHYNQSTPPVYDVTKVDVPVALFTGSHDAMADPTDVKNLKAQLKNIVFEKNVDNWNHFDFVWGMDAAQLAYSHIVDIIKKNSD